MAKESAWTMIDGAWRRPIDAPSDPESQELTTALDWAIDTANNRLAVPIRMNVDQIRALADQMLPLLRAAIPTMAATPNGRPCGCDLLRMIVRKLTVQSTHERLDRTFSVGVDGWMDLSADEMRAMDEART